MRYKAILLLMAMLSCASSAMAQETTTMVNDTIYNPKIIFNGVPQKYEIAGIKVQGVAVSYTHLTLPTKRIV